MQAGDVNVFDRNACSGLGMERRRECGACNRAPKSERQREDKRRDEDEQDSLQKVRLPVESRKEMPVTTLPSGPAMVLRVAACLILTSYILTLGASAQSPLPQVAPGGKKPYLAVLVWHDVLPAKEVWFDTTLATFKDQLEAIRKGGFHVITLEALREHLEHGAPVPAKPLVLTFDDNGSGIYAYAFPLLRKYGYPATLFVHTNYVGKTTSKHHNTWAQLAEMEHSGFIAVQSLTANHPPDLPKLPDPLVIHELRLSKFSLETRLGHKIYALVYPYDNYDERVARLAHENGYEMAFSEDWGNAGDSENLLMIHRYSVLTRFDQALQDVSANNP
jgi:peptidoglycan/xylan/chitin deacetylase (PgdA/CDA1 family)